jgi:hypothetical protein
MRFVLSMGVLAGIVGVASTAYSGNIQACIWAAAFTITAITNLIREAREA